MSNRYIHIDIARGLGILLVVLGHNWIVFNPKGELFNLIYSFHMPLFFVLAGLFFRQGSSFLALGRARVDALIKPYLVTLLLFGVALLATNNLQGADYLQRVLYGTGESLRTLYGEEGKTVYWTPLWFLPHLVVLTLSSWLLVKLARVLKFTETQNSLALAGLFLLGLITLSLSSANGWPFSLDLLPLTLVFFLIGYGIREKLLAFRPSLPIAAAALIIFTACHALFNETIDLNQRAYGDAMIATLQLVTGVYLIMSLSCLLSSRPVLAKALAYVGEASLIILIFHSFIQIKTYYLVSSQLGGDGLAPALLAFVVASTAPVLFYYLFKRFWLLSLFYLPLKKSASEPQSIVAPAALAPIEKQPTQE